MAPQNAHEEDYPLASDQSAPSKAEQAPLPPLAEPLEPDEGQLRQRQFSLAELMLLVTATAVFLSFASTLAFCFPAEHQRAILAGLTGLIALVLLLLLKLLSAPPRLMHGAWWLLLFFYGAACLAALIRR
ncbi:MAG: hypothetical protein ABSG68_11305 [Thermoguttaceae bacterium]|jgi:hypothetical protein